MVSMVSPAATVIAVPPSQLELPDEPGLRSTDPVTSEAPERPGPGTPLSPQEEFSPCGGQEPADGEARGGTLTTGGKSFKAPSHSLGVALAGFRKLDDLPSDRLTKWIGVVGGTERRQSYLECNAHKTDGLGVEALVVQVCPEGHEGTLNAEMFLNHKASSRKGFP